MKLVSIIGQMASLDKVVFACGKERRIPAG